MASVLDSNQTVEFSLLKYYAFGSGEYDLKLTKVDLRKVRLNCEPGFYDDSNGIMDKCKPCEPGTHQADRRKESCLKVQPGYYQNDHQAIGQKICPLNMYQDEIGQSECKQCPVDRVTIDSITRKHPKSLIDGCEFSCLEGTFVSNNWTLTVSPTTARVTCNSACYPGSYNVLGSNECKNCTEGLYQDGYGAFKGCKSCIKDHGVGWFSFRNTTSDKCIEGRKCICENGHGTENLDCPGEGEPGCAYCQDGYFLSEDGMSHGVKR